MLKFLPPLLITGMAFTAYAESGQFQNLEWKNPNEELVYHTCGCADACWVADLIDKASNTPKIQLSCDCEKITLQIGSDPMTKTVYQKNCQAFEKEDKFSRIVDEITKIQSQQ